MKATRQDTLKAVRAYAERIEMMAVRAQRTSSEHMAQRLVMRIAALNGAAAEVLVALFVAREDAKREAKMKRKTKLVLRALAKVKEVRS